MPRWKPFRRKRLLDRGLLIKTMDNAIQNEGGVTNIPNEALKWVWNIFPRISFIIIIILAAGFRIPHSCFAHSKSV